MKPDKERILRGLALTLMVLVVLFLAGRPGARAQTEDEALKAAETAYLAAETDEARLAVVRDFLVEHADHPDVAMVVEVGVRLLVDEMDDTPGAVALVENQLPSIEDPETLAAVKEMLLPLYGSPAYADKLADLVADIYAPEAMTYVDHLEVIRAAAGAEAWTMVDAHIAAAEPLATAEAFRAAYPESDYSPEEVVEAGRNRQGLLRTFAGWSAANRGDAAKARVDFAAAEDLVRKSYFGLPDNELYRFWGLTVIREGEADKGLEMLALAAIYGNDQDAADAALAAFTARGGPAAKFEDFLWRVALEKGPVIDDFTAVDYQDAPRTFSGVRGEKGTLLAFWFPT
jgi:hypothetical protein